MNLTPLLSMPRPALIFPGQASAWQLALADAAASPATAHRLAQLIDAAVALTGPVARPLASVVPGVQERLRELIDPDHGTPRADIDALPAVSVPGILLAQIAAAEHLRDLGLPIDVNTTIMDGHSQGILGVAALDDPVQALAFAFILGAAACSVYGATDTQSRMLSVRGVRTQQMSEYAPVAVINGPRHSVISGTPDALETVRQKVTAAAEAYNAKLEAAQFGGSAIDLSLIHI